MNREEKPLGAGYVALLVLVVMFLLLVYGSMAAGGPP
jgi:hypothetical protein